ncbi:phosphatase PAP2 family protein [Chitinophaga nivalis]|uniref:Phosphatase PAP2 family protein n=1 Tax=Chitinophaga nivalis TaxID=2991709 RepID=A0ABT3IL43_9BACT|nr:phosphatase PAP2 family protein [Chitinophaga nivalis]MCW3465661.1 phosphatase PAP2 family protein [Chitinophaga nivalis]MCW3484648.1 phosphatase PAP2 family protein [Chitinophaga nivalis]
MIRKIYAAGLTLLLLTGVYNLKAQTKNPLADTIPLTIVPAKPATSRYTFGQPAPFRSTIAGWAVPTAMIGYGFLALHTPALRELNETTRDNWKIKDERHKIKIDDYIQYTPFAAVYLLNAVGIHGKHNLRDRTMILGISALITAGTIQGLKRITDEERPDGTNRMSFPSGHTATAFAAAEYLRQEYRDVSPWYGIGGYAVATATGALRIYNNRHWLSDVVAGAGIGILSTKAAYWMYPWVQRKLFKPNSHAATTLLMPYYNAEFRSAGLSLVIYPR